MLNHNINYYKVIFKSSKSKIRKKKYHVPNDGVAKSVDPPLTAGVDANPGVVDPNAGVGVDPNKEPDVDPNGVD
jgi:hypothetical protein